MNRVISAAASSRWNNYQAHLGHGRAAERSAVRPPQGPQGPYLFPFLPSSPHRRRPLLCGFKEGQDVRVSFSTSSSFFGSDKASPAPEEDLWVFVGFSSTPLTAVSPLSLLQGSRP